MKALLTVFTPMTAALIGLLSPIALSPTAIDGSVEPSDEDSQVHLEDGEAYMGWYADMYGEPGEPAPMQMRSAVPTAVPAPPGVPGIDVSGHQRTVDWQYQWDLGNRFAYVKATEGTGFKNPYFSQQYLGSYNQGFIRGAYHFARPDLNSGTAEAEYFVANGGGWSADGKTLPGVLDIEYAPNGDMCYDKRPSELVEWIDDFLRTYTSLVGREAMIYTNFHWWEKCTGNSAKFSTTNSLWLARYSEVMGPLPGSWLHHAIWQFTSTPIDQNRFNGGIEQLRQFATRPEIYPSSRSESLTDVTRIAGRDRFETAANLSADAFDSASTVYVASADDFPDALTIGPSAALDHSPLLLAGDSVPKTTRQELTRLRPERIIVVGGPSAVSDRALTSLEEYAPRVIRWAGADRYQTAATVAQQSHPGGAKTAFVASGLDFPDGLTGGPAAANEDAPLLLTSTRKLPHSTKVTLMELGVQRIIVLGGKQAVPDRIVKELDTIAPTSRIAGSNRYETAARVAEHAFPDSAASVLVASGETFPDALSGGAFAAQLPGPVLLAKKNSVPLSILNQVRRLNPDQVLVMGGSAAVSDTALKSLRDAVK